MKGLITAVGRGTRMRPLTFTSNKHFIPLANKPLLFYALETMAAAGIKEVGINYNAGQLDEIKHYLGNGRKWGLKLTYIFQEKPLGLANIVEVSQEFLQGDKFVMHLGDNIFFGGIKNLAAEFAAKKGWNALLVTIHHPQNKRMGVPYFDDQGNLQKIVEKPLHPPHDWAVPGLYFFDYHAFGSFQGRGAIKPSPRGELEIVSIYNWLLDHGYKVGVREFQGVWKDPGKFDDWLKANQFLLDKNIKTAAQSKPSKGVKIEGRVEIGRGCRITNSLIRGPAIIGNQVTIENSFIGPYSSIANGCHIAGAKIENSILMEGAQIINPPKPFDSSLMGRESSIKGRQPSTKAMKLFIGDQCIIKL